LKIGKTEAESKRYLLDTSAILALHYGEEGAEIVERLLRNSDKGKVEVLISFMSFMEMYYRIWRDFDEKTAKRSYLELKTLPIIKIDVSENLLLLAGKTKAQNTLSVADSWIIATAIESKAVLVHKDPEFEQVKNIVKLLTLPYKK